MNIRRYVIGLSAIALLGLASTANAHGTRYAYGYDRGYNNGHHTANRHRHLRRHNKAHHFRKHARHGKGHFRRSHRHHGRHGIDLYFDGLSVRLYDDGRNSRRY